MGQGQKWSGGLLEEGDNFGGENLCSAEALRVEHDLSNELTVWLGHGQAGWGRDEIQCVCENES